MLSWAADLRGEGAQGRDMGRDELAFGLLWTALFRALQGLEADVCVSFARLLTVLLICFLYFHHLLLGSSGLCDYD